MSITFTNINKFKLFWRAECQTFASEKSDPLIYSCLLAGSSLSHLSVLPPAKSSPTPANAVTDVSTKAYILLDVNRPINSVAGKNMLTDRVSDGLTFRAVPATEPQFSVNST